MKKIDKLLKKVEKPARYIGGEVNSINKNLEDVDLRFAFAFPDTYEIGMSYMGMQILYNILNKEENIFCERVFAPASDMEALMRENQVELFSLETKTSVKEFDVLGFTLQYEMSYTNILNMLDLSNIPLLKKDRDDTYPIVIAGGPCAFNPEPLVDFIDMFLIGDGELLLPQVMKLYKESSCRDEFYKEACKLDGVYVPHFYDVNYNDDGTINSFEKNYQDAPNRVLRSLIPNIDEIPFPTENIVPFISIVHDRSVVETFRGCTRGCRFCQAGMIYRPVRERKKETILELAKKQLKSTGNEELSLLSLSTSDYSDFESLVMELLDVCDGEDISLSLPSLRLDSFSFKVLNEIQKYRKSGLTFAPEAGTQRLRNVINKTITEEDIYGSVRQAIELGWKQIKLYFMIGLPTETYEDLDGIADIAKKILDINYDINGKSGGRFNVTVSVSNFVPKPHTPFQWHSQDSYDKFIEKHNYLRNKLKIKNVSFKYHDSPVSVLEAVFARGDRRTGKLLLEAFKNGCKFDGWSECFNYESWVKAFETAGIDPDFYTSRKREYGEIHPWDIIDSGVSKEFLMSENDKIDTTQDCRISCNGCGINKITNCEMEGIHG
ncbi:MAG: TIGR03960 family B12-binding radical SAM protein [Anaerovoracaceae bacterium]